MNSIDLYKIYIYEHVKNIDFTNFYKLALPFEWYSCIRLSEELNDTFIHYADIDPSFKEDNCMSRTDTGIDACNLRDTIVQAKLRKNSLTWKECSTFFASDTIFSKEVNKKIIRWDKLIITRNQDCKLSKNLLEKSSLFIDKTYCLKEFEIFCQELLLNPPIKNTLCPSDVKDLFEVPISTISNQIQLRDYQIEAIELIKQKPNIIICIPTGCGKNIIMIKSFEYSKKYLVLVPRIILMEQVKEEIIKFSSINKKEIQTIGDGKSTFNQECLITICVYNSIDVVLEHIDQFHKVYVDEAHHIFRPYIYESDDKMNKDKTLSYADKIKSIKKPMVLLSATIDEQNGFEFYKKDIRDMIEKEYLCDYTIHVPIFNTDPTNRNIKEYLINHFRYIIVYCNSQKEGKEFNQLLNSDENLSEYIDCNTPKKKRNDILKRYKNGEIPFLVNVETLTEGFDAPITRGVLFLHLPSSQTKIIQVIGRALRLHPTKKLANVILPYSTSDDEKNISQFLKVLANNDRRIMKSYQSKRQGGYINITTNEEEDSKEEEIQFRYEQIYNSLGKCLLTVEQKIQALIELNRIPKQNEEYEYQGVTFKIGTFWVNIKQGQNKEQYEKFLSKIHIFKEDYERIQKLKEEKSKLTVDQKIQALIVLNRVPKQNETYEYQDITFNIGIFWNGIKQGHNKEQYEKKLSKIDIFKEDYERIQKLKEEKKEKSELSVDQKIQALIKLNRVPKRLEKYEYLGITFKMGIFWDSIKQGQCKERYNKILSKIDIFKEDYERNKKLKEEKEEKSELSIDQKIQALIELNRVPKQNETYEYQDITFNIGPFWDKIKQGQNKEHYEKKLSKIDIFKEDYERIQKLKEKKLQNK